MHTGESVIRKEHVIPVVAIGFLLLAMLACNETRPSPAPLLGTQPETDTHWNRDPANPIANGDGTVIAHVCDPTVIYHEDTFRLWASCVGEDHNYASICYAESDDGSMWSPLMIVFRPGASGAWDGQKVEVPTVILDDTEKDLARRYKMWYGGADAKGPNLTKIGYATSPDGITWTRIPAEQSLDGAEGLVMIPGATVGDAGIVSDPTVLKKGDMFHMWFNSFGSNEDILISYATSLDGIHWTKFAGNPVLRPAPNSWEAGGPGAIREDVSHPTVRWNGSAFAMWYGSFDATNKETYSGIGYAASPDGVAWTKEPGPVFMPDTSSPGEEIGLSTGPSVLYVNDTYHLYYCGVDAQAWRVINHAMLP